MPNYQIINSQASVSGADLTLDTLTNPVDYALAFTSDFTGGPASTFIDSTTFPTPWTQLDTGVQDTNNRVQVFAFALDAGHRSASHVFGVRSGSFSSFCLVLLKNSAASPSDQFNKAHSASTSSQNCGTGITPSEGNCIVLSAVGFAVVNTMAAPAGMSLLAQVNYNAGVNMGCAMASVIQVAAQPINPTWLFGSPSEANAVVKALKGPGGSPGGGITLVNLERGIRGLGRGLALRSGQ